MILAAEFPAIPSSAVKIASDWRCAILVHSALSELADKGGSQHAINPTSSRKHSVQIFMPKKPEHSSAAESCDARLAFLRGREKGSFGKGSFQKRPFSIEFRDSKDPTDCGNERRIRPFSRDSREFRDFRDSRDSSAEKTPFIMSPFSVPDF